jgi:hypothetical protein
VCRNSYFGTLLYGNDAELPDNHALLDRHIHLAVGDVEGVEEILEVAQRSVHAPLTERVYVEFGQWRVDATLRNLQDFFDAFNITDGKMYMPVEERVIIW